jgi:tRNA(Met) cytidine acetyltransferase
VLTSQLRDEAAAGPVGYRVVRIATHHAVRSRGLGSRLLDEVRAELLEADPLGDRLRAADTGSGVDRTGVDWLGVGYGATPELVAFWRENGFRTLYLSTSRNETSGEHSIVMVDPLSAAGRALADRHTDWFLDGIGGVLADPLRSLDADVVRAALRATGRTAGCSLTDREWRVVVDASSGPGLYSVAPDPFRRLALRALTADGADAPLDADQERLLVRKVLQTHPWDRVADELGFVSTSQCMKALGRAYRPLVDRYGNETALTHRRRYEDG